MEEDHTHYAILLGMDTVDKNTTVTDIETNFLEAQDGAALPVAVPTIGEQVAPAEW